MKHGMIGFSLVVLFAGTSSPLAAQELTGYFTGTVTSIDDPANLFAQLHLGVFAYGTYSYDLSATDGDPDPGHGDYTMSPTVSGVTITVGTTRYTRVTTMQIPADVYNDHPTFHDTLKMFNETDASNADQSIVASLLLRDTPEVWLSSDALPPAVPDLAELTFGRVNLIGIPAANPSVQSTVTIELATLTNEPPIPAVSQWGLVLLTLLILTVGTLVCTGRTARRVAAST